MREWNRRSGQRCALQLAELHPWNRRHGCSLVVENLCFWGHCGILRLGSYAIDCSRRRIRYAVREPRQLCLAQNAMRDALGMMLGSGFGSAGMRRRAETRRLFVLRGFPPYLYQQNMYCRINSSVDDTLSRRREEDKDIELKECLDTLGLHSGISLVIQSLQ